MARGRMITNQICRDKKVYGLSDDTCRLLFTWLITFADREGRVHGDPALVRSMIFPRSEIAIGKIDSYLEELQACGLILRFEHAGDRFIWFPKFDKNQPGMRKDREPASELPAPSPADLEDYSRMFSGNLPDDYRQDTGLMEFKRNEAKGREAEAPMPPTLSPRPEIFSVYESEIGALTSFIADQLLAATADYPEDWIREALQEAAAHNARSWAYAEAILKSRKAGRSKPRKSGAGYPQPGGRALTPEQAERGKKPDLTAAQHAEFQRAQREQKKMRGISDENFA